MPSLDAFPSSEDLFAVRRGLIAASEAQGGPQRAWALGIVLRDEAGTVAGGVIGAGFWSWLFVDSLWVRDDLRGQSWGSRLLEAAEAEARRRGAIGVWLDTFSFQAPAFYEARGYGLFGRIEEHPPGAARLFLYKRL